MQSKKLLGYLLGLFSILGIAIYFPYVNAQIVEILGNITIAYVTGQSIIDSIKTRSIPDPKKLPPRNIDNED